MPKASKDVNLFAISKKGKLKKRKLMLVITNTVLSILLAISVIATSLLGVYVFGISGMSVGSQNPDHHEEEGLFEELYVSTSADVSYILVCGEGWKEDGSEKLSDVIMVACLDHKAKTLNMLQIPRDLFTGTDISTYKINAVYAYPRKGESRVNALRRRLASHLGIPLDHYVTFTLKGFESAVNAIGGVDMEITAPNGLKIEDQHNIGTFYTIGPGKVHLDGNAATGFVRKRYGTKEEGYGLGDLDRVKHQRSFYAALFRKLLQTNPTTLYKMITECYEYISTDMDVNTLLGYALEVKEIDMENIGVHSVPGQYVDYRPDYLSFPLSYFSLIKSEYVKMFNQYMNPYGEPLTADKVRNRELHKELGIPTEGDWGPGSGTLDDY